MGDSRIYPYHTRASFLEIRRHGGYRLWSCEGMGDNAFWKFQRQGGLKYGSHPWYGKDILLNHPIGIKLHPYIHRWQWTWIINEVRS